VAHPVAIGGGVVTPGVVGGEGVGGSGAVGGASGASTAESTRAGD
jgi:hypothetical protein